MMMKFSLETFLPILPIYIESFIADQK